MGSFRGRGEREGEELFVRAFLCVFGGLLVGVFLFYFIFGRFSPSPPLFFFIVVSLVGWLGFG